MTTAKAKKAESKSDTAPGEVKVRAIRNFMAGGVMIRPDQEVMLPHDLARSLVSRGHVEIVRGKK